MLVYCDIRYYTTLFMYRDQMNLGLIDSEKFTIIPQLKADLNEN